MTFKEKLDALDLVIGVLKEHERNLDDLVDRAGMMVARFDELVEEKALEHARGILLNALEGLT